MYPLPVTGRYARASARCSNSMRLAHLATVLAMREVSLWLTLCDHMWPYNINKKDRQETDRKEIIVFKKAAGVGGEWEEDMGKCWLRSTQRKTEGHQENSI